MTDERSEAEAAAATLGRLADGVIPALAARLAASGLGELEVRHDGWRVRLRREVAGGSAASAMPAASGDGAARPASPAPATARRAATAPGVGYFTPGERAVSGRAVRAGDPLGWVDVLGVRQEVTAPHDGTVARLLAEAGQAVEYGEELVVVEPPRPAAGAGEG